jgi:hypothetical protein
MKIFLNHNKHLMLLFATVTSVSLELCAAKLCLLLIHSSKQPTQYNAKPCSWFVSLCIVRRINIYLNGYRKLINTSLISMCIVRRINIYLNGYRRLINTSLISKKLWDLIRRHQTMGNLRALAPWKHIIGAVGWLHSKHWCGRKDFTCL